jgi:serine/threonine-protein kinase
MPSGERVKVLDFGIAKLSSRGDAGGGVVRTQTGMLMGTPLYMSPEQCRGTKQVDFRSDIYSLGLMIYQMLAGEPPFVSEGIGELFHMHMNVRQQPLSERVPSLPSGLSAVVDRALEKEPTDRYASMAELQAALVAALKTAPAPARSGVNLQQTGAVPGPRVTTTTLSASAGEAADDTGLEELAGVRSRGRAPLAIAALVVLGIGGVLGARALSPKPAATAAASPAPQPRPETKPPVEEVARPTPPPPPPVAPPEQTPEPATVTVDIATTPARVRVVDAADGKLLGVTPFHDLLPRREGALEVRLEKKGYEPKTISVPLDQKFDGTFELKRAAGPGGGDSSGERIIKL